MITFYFTTTDNLLAAHGSAFKVRDDIASSLSFLELLKLLEESSGMKLVFNKLAPHESGQRVFVADIAKARQLVGWAPKVSARNGCAADAGMGFGDLK